MEIDKEITHSYLFLVVPDDQKQLMKTESTSTRNQTTSNLLSSYPKPHKCEICGNAYKLRRSLKRHKTIHREDNPYRCHYCSKPFCCWPDVRKHHVICKDRPPDELVPNFKRVICNDSLSKILDPNFQSIIYNESSSETVVREFTPATCNEDPVEAVGADFKPAICDDNSPDNADPVFQPIICSVSSIGELPQDDESIDTNHKDDELMDVNHNGEASVNNNLHINSSSNVSPQEIATQELVKTESRPDSSVQAHPLFDRNTSTNRLPDEILHSVIKVEPEDSIVSKSVIQNEETYTSRNQIKMDLDDNDEESCDNGKPCIIDHKKEQCPSTQINQYVDESAILNFEIQKSELSYDCDKCGESFSHVSEWEVHAEAPHIYKCKICSKSFESLNGLFVHKKQHKSQEISKLKRNRELQLYEKPRLQSAAYPDVKENDRIRDETSQDVKQELNLGSELKDQTPNEFFSCNYCGNIFSRIVDLRDHIEIPHIYKCKSCVRSFEDLSSLFRHKKTHKNQEKNVPTEEGSSEINQVSIYKCQVCDLAFQSPQLLLEHNLCSHSQYPCQFCSHIFYDKDDFLLHLSTHKDNGNVCFCCRRDFDSEKHLANHFDMHILRHSELEVGTEPISLLKEPVTSSVSEETKFQTTPGTEPTELQSTSLSQLTTLFTKPDQSRTQLVSQLTQILAKCEAVSQLPELGNRQASPLTESQTKAVSQLINLQSKPPVPQLPATRKKDYICNKCGEILCENATLNRHMNVAHDHQCTLCHKSFIYRRRLKEHMKTHWKHWNQSDLSPVVMATNITTEDQPVCSICGEVFERLYLLKKHLRTHSKFNCPICDTYFKTKDSLVRHRRSHDPNNPFKCILCGKQCLSPSSLRKHSRIHSKHRANVPEAQLPPSDEPSQ